MSSICASKGCRCTKRPRQGTKLEFVGPCVGSFLTSDFRSAAFSGRRLDLPFLTIQSRSPSASRPSAAADRTLQQVDPPPQIRQRDGPGYTLEAGRNAVQRETQIEGDGQAIVSEDHPPEAHQIHPRRKPPTRRANPTNGSASPHFPQTRRRELITINIFPGSSDPP